MGREVVSAVRRRRLNPEFDAPAGTNAAAAPVPLPLVPRPEDGRHHGGRDAPRRSGEPAGEDADPAIGGHRLPDALGQRVAEACQGDRGPGAAPLGQGLIQPQGAESHSRHHVAGEDPGRGQLGLVDDDLPDGTANAAAEKRVEILQGLSPL